MRNWIIISFCTLFIFSCQKLHLSPSHNTLYFSKRNQFEGGINVGSAGAHANVAYTPVKYFAVQSSAYGFINPKNNVYFSNYIEGAIGGYYPFKSSMFALNVGYDEGASNWTYRGLGISGYTIKYARFDTKNTFANLYYAVQHDSLSVIHGMPMRVNLFTDKYYSASADAGALHFVPSNPRSYELCYFLKLKQNKHLYYTFSAG